MLIYITILAVFLIYYLMRKNYSYWEVRGFPQEKPFPFIGNLYKVIVKGQPISERIAEIYSNFKNQPYVGIYTFTKPMLVINNPDLIKRILVKDFNKFADRNFAVSENADQIAANTLFASRVHVWRNVRTKITPVFTSGKMKMMLPLMIECGETLSEVLKDTNNNEIDVRMLAKKYAVDVISSCAFGVNSNCLKTDHSEIFDAAKYLLNPTSITANLSRLCYFFAPKLVDIFRLKFTDKTSTDYLLNVFYTALDERQKLNIQRNDLIDLLNQFKATETINDDYKFDDIKMASQAIVFFSAGNETTSLTITLALYELALNQTIQKRLRDEIRESYQKHNGFTYESLQEMTYLSMVFKETLRKYPIATFLNRQCIDDYIVDETGCKIEKGTSIMIPICGLHCDPDYFPNPMKFDPERFNDDNKDNIKPYTYMPFGEGPRNCIGQRFALLAVKVGIVYALKDFQFDVTENTEIPVKFVPSSFVAEIKNGVMLKVKAL